jgi:ubiquinol-cytochrome c reductase cytochrome b subunit
VARTARGWHQAGLAWLERRTGVRAFVRRHSTDFEVPEESGAGLSLGAVLAFALLLQLATGMLLLLYFVPDTQGAFESVRSLMRDVPYGWLIRLVHAHSANLMVAVVFVHLFRTAFQGAYKDPRELVWVSGCVLFLLVLGAALTGYILPWSQMSYWATTVITASLEYAPLLGGDLVSFVRGGEFVGDATFRRAFAAHVALIPLLLLAAVGVHLALVRRAGLAGRARRSSDTTTSALVPFFPRVAVRYALGIVAFLFVLTALVLYAPNLFLPPDHRVPADPFETPPNVKPEWYFLWAYELPRLMPEALALSLQGVALAALFALPFIDRSRHRHPLDRPLITAGLLVALVLLVGLSVLGYLA